MNANTPHAMPNHAQLTVDALQASDFVAWQRLAQGYHTFYERELPESSYQHAWQRLLGGDGIHGLAARVDGQLRGITHYLFHPATWSHDVCYLQDLFVDESARGKGVAQALIEHGRAHTRRAQVVLADPSVQRARPTSVRPGRSAPRFLAL